MSTSRVHQQCGCRFYQSLNCFCSLSIFSLTMFISLCVGVASVPSCMPVHMPVSMYFMYRMLLAFSQRVHKSARTKLELLNDFRIITVVMYLAVSGARELFLEPCLKDCHLMDSLNRMGFIHLTNWCEWVTECGWPEYLRHAEIEEVLLSSMGEKASRITNFVKIGVKLEHPHFWCWWFD